MDHGPGKSIHCKVASDIPIGHKIAIRPLAANDTVFKFGVDIARTIAPIKRGEHAHLHNLSNRRW